VLLQNYIAVSGEQYCQIGKVKECLLVILQWIREIDNLRLFQKEIIQLESIITNAQSVADILDHFNKITLHDKTVKSELFSIRDGDSLFSQDAVSMSMSIAASPQKEMKKQVSSVKSVLP
jgi:hypothetical protein